MVKCERCDRDAPGTIMSYFNTEIICLDCGTAEREHPLFEKARKADEAAIRLGDFNFPGIGLPEDLKPKNK